MVIGTTKTFVWTVTTSHPTSYTANRLMVENEPLDLHFTSTGIFNVVLTGKCAAGSDLTMKLCGSKSCLTCTNLISPLFLRRKHTNTYIYRILFHYVANNDIQIYWYTTFTVRVCAFVSVCVCLLREQWDHRKQNENPVWVSPQWLNKAEIASKRAVGNSLGRHTHTHAQTS